MREPIDIITGKIKDWDPRTGELLITAQYDDYYTMLKREYNTVRIELTDSRKLSDKQRKSCYAMIGEIADYAGMSKSQSKAILKVKFLADDLGTTADHLFSLSDGSMSLVCAFQRFLVRFILDYDIPCSHRLLDFVDDIDDYLYGCAINKKCCICGKPADLHHTDRIGMGNNRDEIVHEGMKALPLCRVHHTEAHTMGHDAFVEKYHLGTGYVILDKALCKVYGLKTKKEIAKDAKRGDCTGTTHE